MVNSLPPVTQRALGHCTIFLFLILIPGTIFITLIAWKKHAKTTRADSVSAPFIQAELRILTFSLHMTLCCPKTFSNFLILTGKKPLKTSKSLKNKEHSKPSSKNLNFRTHIQNPPNKYKETKKRNHYTRAILQATENSFHRHDKAFYHPKTFYLAAWVKKSQVHQQNAEVEVKLKIKARRERRRKERAEMSLPWPYLRNIPVKILELFPRFTSVSLSWGEKRPIKGKRHMCSILYKGQVFLHL